MKRNINNLIDYFLDWSVTPERIKECPLFDECHLNPQEVDYRCYNDYEECPLYDEFQNAFKEEE